jgi:acetyl esterase/lipase
MWPFVREAVERGYVVICPEYRGSTGYGQAHHNAIDYGGYEIDDVITAYDYMTQNLPHVDPARVGIMGWSHGGYITVMSVTRDNHPFKVGAAIVPVTNLFQRLSWKGPDYQRSFSTQARRYSFTSGSVSPRATTTSGSLRRERSLTGMPPPTRLSKPETPVETLLTIRTSSAKISCYILLLYYLILILTDGV